MSLLSMLSILAADAPKSDAPPLVNFLSQNGLMLMLFVIMGLFLFSSFRRKQSEERARRDMLNALKKGDKVQTIGGILGTVLEARETEVTLKVDESTNTRMKFVRSAIHRVVDAEKPEKVEKK